MRGEQVGSLGKLWKAVKLLFTACFSKEAFGSNPTPPHHFSENKSEREIRLRLKEARRRFRRRLQKEKPYLSQRELDAQAKFSNLS